MLFVASPFTMLAAKRKASDEDHDSKLPSDPPPPGTAKEATASALDTQKPGHVDSNTGAVLKHATEKERNQKILEFLEVKKSVLRLDGNDDDPDLETTKQTWCSEASCEQLRTIHSIFCNAIASMATNENCWSKFSRHEREVALKGLKLSLSIGASFKEAILDLCGPLMRELSVCRPAVDGNNFGKLSPRSKHP